MLMFAVHSISLMNPLLKTLYIEGMLRLSEFIFIWRQREMKCGVY